MRTITVLAALAILCPVWGDDDETWRESAYALTGDPQPDTDRKPLYRIRRRAALQLRVHFEEVRLTDGEVLEIYDARLNLIQQMTRSARGVWSQTVPGGEAWLRLRHRGDGPPGQFTVDRIATRRRLPAPSKGTTSPSHYLPRLTAVKIFRVHPNGDHDLLRPGSTIRLARKGARPDGMTFAVRGYDQKGQPMSRQRFRPMVSYSGSTLKGRLVPVASGVWRFESGAFSALGLTVTIAVPDKAVFSTKLLVDILEDNRSGRQLSTIRVARRRTSGKLEALASGSAVTLDARGAGLDTLDLSVTGLDRKGRELSPAALKRLRFSLTPPAAGRIETKSLGEYRLHSGVRGTETATLILRTDAHEAFRLTLQIIARPSHTIPAAAPVRRSAEQSFDVSAISRLVVEPAYRGRRQFQLSGPPPAKLQRVTLVLADGSKRVIHHGGLGFQKDWRWAFEIADPLAAVEVAWRGKPGAILRLRTVRRPADGPAQGTRNTPSRGSWRSAGSVLGRPQGERRGQAWWTIGFGLAQARQLRVTPHQELTLDRLVVSFSNGDSKTLPANSMRLPSGHSAAFEIPGPQQLSRVVLYYRSRSEAAQPRVSLALLLADD